MFIYYFIFFVAVALYFVMESQDDPTKANILLILTMLSLALFVGLADMLGGYDRYIYCDLFDDVANYIDNRWPVFQAQIFKLYPKEHGYGLYNVLVGCITANRYIFVLITTFIIYAMLLVSIYKYCSNYPFAVILFLGLWFFFTFTYLRQAMGATIVWLSIQYIAKRNLPMFLLIWFIAFTFHNSAIVFLPMYFIPVRKFDKRFVMYVMAAVLVLGLTSLPTAVFSAYGEVDAGRADVVSYETGFRIAYILEAGFFLALIFLKYDDIPERPLNIVLLNMALVFCAILLFFVKNENGGRLSWYYMIGVIATVTYICTTAATDRKYMLLMIAVSFFLFNRILTSWGNQLYPYKSFLTDGVRPYDYVWSKFEYDHKYDDDKMYRPPFRFANPF